MSNQHLEKAIQDLIDNGVKEHELPTPDEVDSSLNGTQWPKKKSNWSLVKNSNDSYNVSF